MGQDQLFTAPTFKIWALREIVPGLLVALAAIVGLALLVDTSRQSSATYDEVAYLRVAARWWRTGDQAEITRMGSPLTFWKLQQAPVLWLLDRTGHGAWIDDPIAHQRELLPVVRIGSTWIWVVALGLTAAWSRQSYGPRAMALAAWLFALSPNLVAHGALATMELPLVAATTAMFFLFWRFLGSNRWGWFWASAAVGGLALSCKFTTVLFPPILAVIWWEVRRRSGERPVTRLTRRVATGMLGFLAVMLLANLIVTGFARIPLSESRGHHPSIEGRLGAVGREVVTRLYETPLPQDWVGFATQCRHQATGGSSYLFGERRMTGWWYYYFVALAVKVPLAFWFLVVARLATSPGGPEPPLTPPSQGGDKRRPIATYGVRRLSDLLPLPVLLFLAITAVGSSRNYGLRYLLPMAPLAIVWVSALGEIRGAVARRVAVAAGLVGYVAALAGSHPHELTYFNALAGGSRGGRHILADSNLDWGQGLRSMARLQHERPEFRDVTLYYFGDSDPAFYGVVGRCHVVNAVDDHSRLPRLDDVRTAYLAVSASLQFGPWGPEGFFRSLDRVEPVRLTDDITIAIYRTSDRLDGRTDRDPVDSVESGPQ